MTVVDDFLAGLSDANRQVIGGLYQEVRSLVPEASEERSYGMPAFKYKGKGLIAIMPTKAGFSLYPFCAVDRLRLNLSAYETTKGSLHFTEQHTVTIQLLTDIIQSRQRIIDDDL